MSEQNVEFVRRGYEALEHGDLEAFKELARDRLDPEFEFHHVWDGRVFKGYEGTMEWLSDTQETWKDYRQEVQEIIDLEEHVVVVLGISAQGAGSGVPVAQEFAVVWTFDGPAVVRARSFTSRADALEAVGMSKYGPRVCSSRAELSDTVRVAAIQATPVILDAEATVEKACGLLGRGGRARASSWRCSRRPSCPSTRRTPGRTDAASFEGWDEFWERLWENSVDVPGPHTDRLADGVRASSASTARSASTSASPSGPGSLYNALLLIGPEGLLAKHRKLMPTMHERLFHGVGAGRRPGGHRDPGRPARRPDLLGEHDAARSLRASIAAARRSGSRRPPTTRDGWLASMRHIALESGAFVVSVPQFIPASAFPDDFPVPLPEGKEVFGRGGAAIVEPTTAR